MRLGSDAEAGPDLAGRVLGDHDDQVGALRVARRERGIVAPDLGAAPAGVIEEIEIVDGDDLDGAVPARQQQGMGRVGNVHRSGKALHRRPFQPVPGKVEDPDRHADVNDAGAGKPVRLQPVLP